MSVLCFHHFDCIFLENSTHLGNSQFVTDISVVKKNLNLEKEVMTGSVIIPSNLDPSTSKTDYFSQYLSLQFDTMMKRNMNREITATSVQIPNNLESSNSTIASFFPPSEGKKEVVIFWWL